MSRPPEAAQPRASPVNCSKLAMLCLSFWLHALLLITGARADATDGHSKRHRLTAQAARQSAAFLVTHDDGGLSSYGRMLSQAQTAAALPPGDPLTSYGGSFTNAQSNGQNNLPQGASPPAGVSQGVPSATNAGAPSSPGTGSSPLAGSPPATSAAPNEGIIGVPPASAPPPSQPVVPVAPPQPSRQDTSQPPLAISAPAPAPAPTDAPTQGAAVPPQPAPTGPVTAPTPPPSDSPPSPTALPPAPLLPTASAPPLAGPSPSASPTNTAAPPPQPPASNPVTAAPGQPTGGSSPSAAPTRFGTPSFGGAAAPGPGASPPKPSGGGQGSTRPSRATTAPNPSNNGGRPGSAPPPQGSPSPPTAKGNATQPGSSPTASNAPSQESPFGSPTRGPTAAASPSPTASNSSQGFGGSTTQPRPPPPQPTASAPQQSQSSATTAPTVTATRNATAAVAPALPPRAMVDIPPATVSTQAAAAQQADNSTLGISYTLNGQNLLPWVNPNPRQAFEITFTDYLHQFSDFNFTDILYVGSVGIGGPSKPVRRRTLLANAAGDQVTVYYDIHGVSDLTLAAKDLASVTSTNAFRTQLQNKGVDVQQLQVVSTRQGGIGNIPLVIPINNSKGGSGSNTGAIAGAVIGGIVMLLLIALVSILCVRHKRGKRSERTPNGTYTGAPFAKQCADPVKEFIGSPTGYIRPATRFVVTDDARTSETLSRTESRNSTHTDYSTAALNSKSNHMSHLHVDSPRSEAFAPWPTPAPRPFVDPFPQLAPASMAPPDGQPRIVLGDQNARPFDAFARSVSQQNPQPPLI